MSDYKGKCDDCKDNKSLDEMVKKEKGLYHCGDCKDKIIIDEYDPLMSGLINREPIKLGRFLKLFRWCFG